MSLTEEGKGVLYYKSYAAKHLVSYKYLEDYWPSEFDIFNFYKDENERFEKLILYG